MKKGETEDPVAKLGAASYKDYFDEFSGTKRRKRQRELEYSSRHGDVVSELNTWRVARGVNGKSVKNAFIDLGIERGDTLVELYEVKTSCDRQALYTAFGQLMVHDKPPTHQTKKFLVVPAGQSIASDVQVALDRHKISVLRYVLKPRSVEIVEPV